MSDLKGLHMYIQVLSSTVPRVLSSGPESKVRKSRERSACIKFNAGFMSGEEHLHSGLDLKLHSRVFLREVSMLKDMMKTLHP